MREEKITPNCVVKAAAFGKHGQVLKKHYWNVILNGEYKHVWFNSRRDAANWLIRQQNKPQQGT